MNQIKSIKLQQMHKNMIMVYPYYIMHFHVVYHILIKQMIYQIQQLILILFLKQHNLSNPLNLTPLRSE
eukprot:UN05156